MRKIILGITGLLLMVSCGEEGYWNESNKSGFIKGCENSLNKSLEKSGVDPMEQLGTTAEKLCECQLTKTMEEFPEGSTDKALMMQSAAKNTQACIAELKN